MPPYLDIPDTQVWVYAANQQHQWAVDIYEEVLNGQRIVYISRYIAAEFYQVMIRGQGQTGRNKAYSHLINLWQTNAAIVPHPFVLSGYNLTDIRYNARTVLLQEITGTPWTDTPILADAYRIADLVAHYNPPSSQPHIPHYPEEFRLLDYLDDAGVNRVTSRILTNDNPFAAINPSTHGITNVEIEKVP